MSGSTKKRVWICVILTLAFWQSSGLAQTSITATPTNVDLDFPVNPATGWPGSVTQTVQVTIQATGNVDFSLGGLTGLTANDVSLQDAGGQDVALNGGSANIAPGSYTLSITVSDPGPVPPTPWAGTLQIRTGGRRPQTDSVDLSGNIGRDLGSAPTPPGPTPPGPTPPTSPPTGIPTTWSGGSAALHTLTDSYRVILEIEETEVELAEVTPDRGLRFNSNVARTARLTLRGNERLNILFIPESERSYMSDRTLVSGSLKATPLKRKLRKPVSLGKPKTEFLPRQVIFPTSKTTVNLPKQVSGRVTGRK